ncbi:MAG TPA: DUF397 domain-containing protein [Micromonosporaceae bacterium]
MNNQKTVTWRKSSRSGLNGNCVEFAQLDSAITVRDSKNPTGPTLLFTTREWRHFIHATKGGLYDL